MSGNNERKNERGYKTQMDYSYYAVKDSIFCNHNWIPLERPMVDRVKLCFDEILVYVRCSECGINGIEHWVFNRVEEE